MFFAQLVFIYLFALVSFYWPTLNTEYLLKEILCQSFVLLWLQNENDPCYYTCHYDRT